MKIALTSVTVNSPAEAFTFYTEVLGFVKGAGDAAYYGEWRAAVL